MHGIESRFVIGPENILLATVCEHFLARKLDVCCEAMNGLILTCGTVFFVFFFKYINFRFVSGI